MVAAVQVYNVCWRHAAAAAAAAVVPVRIVGRAVRRTPPRIIASSVFYWFVTDCIYSPQNTHNIAQTFKKNRLVTLWRQ